MSGLPNFVPARLICVNDECQIEFMTTSFAQKWCPDCIEFGDRNRILNRRAARKEKGRICVWCLRTDEDTLFHGSRRCMACYNRGRKNGCCQDCSSPLRKLGNGRGISYCEHCDGFAPPEGYFPVTLLWDGEKKTVYKSGGCKFRDPDGSGNLRNLFSLIHTKVNGGEIVMQVEVNDYMASFTKNPLAVKGLPDWPDWVELADSITGPFSSDLADLLHFIRVERENPVRKEWWIGKFRRDATKEAAERSWERFKSKLRATGLRLEDRRPEDELDYQTRSLAIWVNPDDLAGLVDMTTRIMDRKEITRRVRHVLSARRRKAAMSRRIRDYDEKRSAPVGKVRGGEETSTADVTRGDADHEKGTDTAEGSGL